jgi:hypothetical protein
MQPVSGAQISPLLEAEGVVTVQANNPVPWTITDQYGAMAEMKWGEGVKKLR